MYSKTKTIDIKFVLVTIEIKAEMAMFSVYPGLCYNWMINMKIALLVLFLCCVSVVDAQYVGDSKSFTEVPHDVISSTETEISLSVNSITRLGDLEFAEYTALWKLTMNKNQITFISDTAFANTKIKFLKLDDNSLSSFPNVTYLDDVIKEISLKQNSITTIPNALLSPLVKVSHLFLNNNPLTVWPDFTGLGSAGFTDLNVNGILLPNEISPSICNMDYLNWGHASTGIPYINCPQNATTKLERLYLKERGIEYNSNFSALNSLVEAGSLNTLYFDLNPMDQFPDFPKNMRKVLKVLFFKYSIRTVNPAFLTGLSMTKLSLSNNKITTFPCELFHITEILLFANMKTLSMDGAHWRKCLCRRNAYPFNKLDLQGSLNTLSEFPDLSTVLCKYQAPLNIILTKVILYIKYFFYSFCN